MANGKEFPILIACSCGLTPTLNFVSVGQTCEPRNCGETLCTTRQADDRFDENGNCIPSEIAQICSPNYESLSQIEKCRNRRYQKIVTKDTSGGPNHGRITTKQYSVNNQGQCISETTCEGSKTTILTFLEPICTGSTSCTETYNQNCIGTTNSGGSGSVTSSLGGGLCCESNVNSDCTSNGQIFFCESEDKGSIINDLSCGSFQCPANVKIIPEPDCTITVTYSNPDNEKICTPEILPSYPEFTQCDTEPPILQPGQGYSNSAYKYIDLYDELITNEQKIKYRIEHPPIFPACYLKVWVTKVTQKWIQESCGTQNNPCCLRWVEDGQPIKTDQPVYIWESPDCDYDLEENLSQCEYIIYGEEREIVPEENESIHIEIKKYSYVEGYEPEDPDENGNQPCRPNGWPLIKC